MKICPNCNKEFKEKYKEQKFCCRDCSDHYSGNKGRQKSSSSKEKVKRTIRINTLIKNGILTETSSIKEIDDAIKKYYPFENSKLRKCVCKVCGKEFLCSVRGGSKRNTCSKECRHTIAKTAGIKGGCASASIQIRRSKNEILMGEYCAKLFGKENVLFNETMFDGWDADIIIPKLKVAILWNGAWHYKQISKKQSLKQVQNRDKLKLKIIKQCGYKPYIIKDLGGYNETFVKEEFNNFLKSLEHI